MKIGELVLLTADPDLTKDFYSKFLQLEICNEENNSISFRVGRTILIFKTTAKQNPVYHVAFNIPNNKIEDAAQWCEGNHIQLIPYPAGNRIIDFPNWNAKSIYFLDNTGNVLEFIARRDLRNETSTAFDSKQILCISEIGIVTRDVTEFCSGTSQEFGVPIYEKQKPTPHFSVMGDAEGLLIVVPEKRKWFPTNILSENFPTEVIFEQGSGWNKIER